MTNAPTRRSARIAVLGTVMAGVLGTAFTVVITGWRGWDEVSWVVLLHAAVGAWALTLWRSAWPDRVGAVCTLPALTPILLAVTQLVWVELSAAAVVWAFVGAAIVSVGRLFWERAERPRRMLGFVREALNLHDPDFVRPMSWMSSLTTVYGLAQDIPAADREQCVDRACSLLRMAGADPAVASTETSTHVTGQVNGVSVNLELRCSPTAVASS